MSWEGEAVSVYPKGNEIEQAALPLGCIFCKTGSEEAAARLLETTPRLHRAFVPKKVEHRSKKGVKSTVKKVLFPGYVFFLAEENWTPTLAVYHADYVLRLLRTDNGWQLMGGDEELVRWLLRHDGLLDLSKAYQEGTRVVIKSGPLKELEGVITKVDKHNRNGRVTLEMFGRKTDVWLAFELVEEKDATMSLESARAKA